jgi:hypothetical protein
MNLHELLIHFHRAILGAHILGIALGLGGATVADVLFFKFLRDLKLSPFETKTLHTVSLVIWVGIALLIMSGTGLFLSDTEKYLHSAKFLTKMIVVAVVISNGIFMNVVLTPHLKHMRFGKDHVHKKGELRHDRKLAFVSGALSMSSWYFAFAMGVIQKTSLGFGTLLGIYLLLVGCAVSVALCLKHYLSRK